MATANSKAAARPRKPRDDFPLFAHHNGQWAKKVRGKLHYFGPWCDADAALQEWVDQRDDLLAGRVPRKRRGDITLRDMVNRFLTAKQLRVDSGELSPRSFNDLHAECERLIEYFGKERYADDFQPEDFELYRAHLAKGRNAKTLDNIMNRQRSIFRWAYRNRLLKLPTEFGDAFNRPSRDTLDRERARNGERLFVAKEINALLKIADVPMKPKILLGINCGLGNADIGRLEFRHLDLDGGWLTFPRHKTGVKRRSKLWPETVKAIKASLKKREAALKKRPVGDEFINLVFLTKQRRPYTHDDKADSPISLQFRRMLVKLGIYRPGLSFYTLRHTFRTEADDCLDQPAVNYAMGHKDKTMAGNYRQRIRDERLEAVATHVHNWLFGKEGGKQ